MACLVAKLDAEGTKLMTIEAVPCPHSGCVDLRDGRYPDDGVLHLTAAEWAEFFTAARGLRRADRTDETTTRDTPSLLGTPRSEDVPTSWAGAPLDASQVRRYRRIKLTSQIA